MSAVDLPLASELANLLAVTYIERRDSKARQWNGGYAPVVVNPKRDAEGNIIDPTRLPFTKADLLDHVQGAVTYGHYLVSLENKCRMFAFDLDLSQTSKWTNTETGEIKDINPREVWLAKTTPEKRDLALQLKSMAFGFAEKIKALIECKVTVHYSGSKGMHVIGCLDKGTPAFEAREMALLVLASFDSFEPLRGKNFWKHRTEYQAIEIEVFPKQDEVRDGDGMGNLLRLPLGLNRKTNQESFFLDFSTPWQVIGKDDPLLAMKEGSLRVRTG